MSGAMAARRPCVPGFRTKRFLLETHIQKIVYCGNYLSGMTASHIGWVEWSETQQNQAHAEGLDPAGDNGWTDHLLHRRETNAVIQACCVSLRSNQPTTACSARSHRVTLEVIHYPFNSFICSIIMCS